MRNSLAGASARVVLALLLIVSLVVLGDMRTVRAEEPATVEGEWVITTSNYPDHEGGFTIVRQDGGYNVIPKNQAQLSDGKHGGGVGLYYGNQGQITISKNYSFDEIAGLAEPNVPRSVIGELAGKVVYRHMFNLSADGQSLEYYTDNFTYSYDPQTGHLLNYQILPYRDKATLARASSPSNPTPPVTNTAASAPVNKASRAVAQVESRGEFYFLTKDGRKVNGEEASKVSLEEGTKVVTGNDGHIRMTLPDNTTFTVGPNSDLVIDKFVYDLDKSPEKIMATMTKGVFRWVTGKTVQHDPTQMKITLPVVAVGIRGTDFEATVEPNGIGSVVLNFGQLEITEKKTGFTFVMDAGQKITFGADGSVSRPMKIQ